MGTIIDQDVVDSYIEDRIISTITILYKEVVPDLKDGLKSVQRRILYAMLELGAVPHKHYYKSARIVGDTMGKYHPHGDVSIYDAMVLMATFWDSKIPYIDTSGNFGTIEGEKAAAMRYTEARLSNYAYDYLMSSLSSCDTVVEWDKNYNNDGVEPQSLPARVPNLLINGCLGIAVGLTSSIPRHNVSEVVQAAIQALKHPEKPVVLIPDHCQKVDIIDTDWLQICATGHGKYKARAIIDIETHKDGCPMLVIKSYPDRVTFASKVQDKGVINKILKLMKEGKLTQIKDLYTETNGDDLRFIIHLHNGANPEYVKSQLYKMTPLEQTYSINMYLNDGLHQDNYSYNGYFQALFNAQRDVYFRLYMSKYAACNTELAKYNFYVKMINTNGIDEIIAKIRKMKRVDEEAKRVLMEDIISHYDITDIEVKYLLSINLMKIAVGYLSEYQLQIDKLNDEAQKCYDKLMNDNFDDDIIRDLKEFDKEFGGPRLCNVITVGDDEEIPKGLFRIVITENNFIKKLNPNDNVNIIKRDVPKYTVLLDNTDSVILFDMKGKAFKVPVYKIPLMDKTSQGINLAVLIKNCTSTIINVIEESRIINCTEIEESSYLVLATTNNCIKKVALTSFLNVNFNGTVYTKLNEGDTVTDVAIMTDSMDAIIYSDHKALRLSIKSIPEYKRMAYGVAGMSSGTKLDGLASITSDATDIIVVTNTGRINRFPVSGFSCGNRATAGSSIIKLAKNASIVAIYGVNIGMGIYLTTTNGDVCIPVSDIPVCSSISSGTQMVKGATVIKAMITQI